MQRLTDDSKEVDSCIEELYRYDSAGQFMGRTATEDVEIGGVTIPKGETVIMSWAPANRDPAHFDQPDRLILDRKFGKEETNHLTFGVSRHACIGVSLAQAKKQIEIDVGVTD